jgi:flagellar FliL protein
VSAAAASPAAAEAAPKKARGKGKLLIIVGLVLAVVLAGAGGAVFFMTQQAAQAEGEEHADEATTPARRESARSAAPVFVPLEVFTVNLADRGGERFAQIGVTLEVANASVEARLKAVMPVIRSNILLALARKTSDELLQHEGRLRLAAEIRVETLRPLGHEVALEALLPAATEGEAEASPQRQRARRALQDLPVQQVHFSNFIIQ